MPATDRAGRAAGLDHGSPLCHHDAPPRRPARRPQRAAHHLRDELSRRPPDRDALPLCRRLRRRAGRRRDPPRRFRTAHRLMAALASYNVKGGVGKTATVVNLAHRAAISGQESGARTLIFDLDPQGAASYYFRAAPKVDRRGKSLVQGKVDVRDAVTPTDFPGIDLIPSDFSFRNLDVVLDAAKDPGRSLARVVRPLATRSHHVFLDCPPRISRLSENVFNAADALLVPIIPTTLSLRALDQLNTFLAQRKERSPLV